MFLKKNMLFRLNNQLINYPEKAYQFRDREFAVAEVNPPYDLLPLPSHRGAVPHLEICQLSYPKRIRHPLSLAMTWADHVSGT